MAKKTSKDMNNALFVSMFIFADVVIFLLGATAFAELLVGV